MSAQYVCSQIRIKLIDLDSARVFSLSSFKPLDRFTVRNCATEVMRAQVNLRLLRPDFTMDIFCVGLILLQLLDAHGRPVFAEEKVAIDH